MRAIDPALGKGFALSILLHALVLAAGGWLDEPVRRAVAAPEVQLEVTLRSREALASLPLALFLDEWLQPAVRPSARVQPARQGNAQMARELLYPPEAIARGLEGEALVLLFLDASGNAIAARLEASSGHALLDDAAVRAARKLRALPDSAPRETLLPVRFRLR